jgi:hypothetical protein
VTSDVIMAIILDNILRISLNRATQSHGFRHASIYQRMKDKDDCRHGHTDASHFTPIVSTVQKYLQLHSIDDSLQEALLAVLPPLLMISFNCVEE